MQQHYIIKALLTLCFWLSETSTFRLISKNRFEVSATGVYMHSRGVQRAFALVHTFRVYYTSNVGVFLCLLLIKVVLDHGQQAGFRKHPRLVCVVRKLFNPFVKGACEQSPRIYK